MRRRLMLRNATGGGGVLPPEYQQVDYIESSRTQWLKIPYSPSDNDTITVITKLTSYTDANYGFYGAQVGGAVIMFGGDKNETQFFTQTPVGSWLYTGLVSLDKITINLDLANSIVSVDGSDYSISGHRIGTTVFQNGMALFGILRPSSTAARLVSAKIYSFYAEANGVSIISLIPCYRKSDGVIGMYDTVSGAFFTNAGTGAFTKGADVN